MSRSLFVGLALACALGAAPPQQDPRTKGRGARRPAAASRVERAAALREELSTIEQREREALEALAQRMEGAGRAEEAARVREIRPAPEADASPRPIRFRPLPEFVPKAEAAGPRPALPPEAIAIHEETTDALLALARRAGDPDEGRYALADECLRLAVERNPDHPEVRRLLGFVRHDGGWATPFAADQLRSGKVLHPKYGWVEASWVEHLERGELPGTEFRGEQPVLWLPAAEADALRAEFEQGWRITTDHYKLRANVPLDEAIAFGRRLEAFDELFFALMSDAIGRERLPLARRLAAGRGTPPRAVDRQHEVWYFAERPQYIAFFRDQFGRDESQSLGYTMPPGEARSLRVPPRSYFFRDAEQPIDAGETLFHEASHQLLFESAGPTRYDRNAGHFWVWEGLGTYFETVRGQPDGSIEVGGPVGARIAQARVRLLDRGGMIPLREFVGLGRARFEEPREVYTHYIQAMALAMFLMHGQGGAYRDGFLDYVRAAYDGRLTADRSLDAYLEMPFPALERQFGLFLGHLPGDEAGAAPAR